MLISFKTEPDSGFVKIMKPGKNSEKPKVLVSNTNSSQVYNVAFQTGEYPYGMSVSNDGFFSGTVNESSTWNVVFKVTDDNNISSFRTLTFTSVPFIPQNVTISSDQSSASLSWDAVPGALSYDIYRSAEPYSGFVKIGNSATASYVDSVTGADKYFYYIVTMSNK